MPETKTVTPQSTQPGVEEIRALIEGQLRPRRDGFAFHLESFLDAVRIAVALRHGRVDEDALFEAILSTVSELLRELVYLDEDGAPGSPGRRRPRRPQRQDHLGRFTERFARRFARRFAC